MGFFRQPPPAAPEARAISYQDFYGRGENWIEAAGGSVEDALRVSAGMACVREIAAQVAQLPMHTFDDTATGLVRCADSPLIAHPSARLRPHEWLTAGTVSLALWGNCYGVIAARDALGTPTQIELVHPDSVAVTDTGPFSRPTYTISGRPVPASDMFHLRGFTPPGSVVGLAPLQRAGLIEVARLAQEFGRRWFSDGAHPSAIITSDQELDAAQATAIKQSFIAALGRKREPAVMGSGLRYERIQVNANESQFLDTMRQAHFEICAVFGMPPSQIGFAMAGSSITYENREAAQSALLTRCLNGFLVAWQEGLSELLPVRKVTRFNTGAFLRSDLKTRYAAHAVGVAAGFLTPNEARAFEDLAPIEGGDTAARTPLSPIQQVSHP